MKISLRVNGLLVFLLSIFILPSGLFAQRVKTSLSYYMPQGYTYNPNIPTPDKILGFQVGDRHVTHDQIVYYAREMARVSPRFKLLEIGQTYESRPYLLLIISSEANQKRLAEIKSAHVQLSDPQASSGINLDDQPSFVWLGHSIHGNENTGANAGLLTLYFLAAAQGPAIDNLLAQEVIFIDPSENPDGIQRFSGWVNQNRFVRDDNTDPQTREHKEAWPGGRFNHFWFDLNRDWLPLQMPESQGKIAALQEWKPNILIDEHEQGTNATFHVSPGERDRVHPLIPQENQDLTLSISQFVAKGLDSISALYTSREGYDDYYNGRGPTYLDFNGGVAMLFEQARSVGYAIDSDNGLLTFPYGIRNQFVASLAVLKAGLSLRKNLLQYQRTYAVNNVDEGRKSGQKAYIFGSEDQARAYRLAELLKRHAIEVFHVHKDKKIQKAAYTKEGSYLVPLDQVKYRLIQSIFEKRTAFKDSLFYDISGWTFPLAFNVDYTTISPADYSDMKGDAFQIEQKPASQVWGEGKQAYAYVLDWTGYYAPKVLYQLLAKGIITKVATDTFTVASGKTFGRGSVLIPVDRQPFSANELYQVLKQTVDSAIGVNIYTITGGETKEEHHLGSNSFLRVPVPKAFMLTDGGVDALKAGAIWHLMDIRYEMPLTMIPTADMGSAHIEKYNVMIMADGNYGDLGKGEVNKLREWIAEGNTLIAYESALSWLQRNELLDVPFKRQRVKGDGVYGNFRTVQRAAYNPGSIAQVKIDITHPLFYGYQKDILPFFKSTNFLFDDSVKNSYNHPARFTEKALLSGYLPKGFEEVMKGSPEITVKTIGRGRIIAFTDDTNFRAFWYGTNKVFANALFFGSGIIAGTGQSQLGVSRR